MFKALLLLVGLCLAQQDLEELTLKEASKLVVEVLGTDINQEFVLEIPWSRPSFQFWKSYYQKEKNREKLIRRINRFLVFYPTVRKIFLEEGLPEELAFLAIVESGGNPGAISRAGAGGLWQLMPKTARLLGLKVGRYVDERFDVEKSTRAAVKYLKKLYQMFGSWDLAIAAYNAGPGSVLERLKKLGRERFWDLTNLPEETLNYVPRFYAVLSVAKEYLESACPVKDRLVKVKVIGRASLYRISKKLGVSYKTLKYYNPHFRRKVILRKGTLYIPYSALTPKLKRISEKAEILVYIPRRKERTLHIARKFGIAVSLLKLYNRVGKFVRRGQSLIIPVEKEA